MIKILGIDTELSIYWYEEVRWLRDNGIRYVFVKEVKDEKTGKNITVWKYKKTKELFEALAEFYDI